ncbi:hypothetical protein [Helicobacter pylori]|nr:hypothetical protein [Helicobacter pylori]
MTCLLYLAVFNQWLMVRFYFMMHLILHAFDFAFLFFNDAFDFLMMCFI